MGVISSGVASPQQAGFSGPVEGFIFDSPTASLRPVAGIPGAATFGRALVEGLEFASAAPQRNYAVAFQSGNPLLVTGLSLDPSSVSTAPIAALSRVPERIAWTSDGSFAVLYSRAAGWIQTLSGLPGNPVASGYISIAALGGSLSAVAVDSKQQVAIAVTGPGAGVYLLTGGQSFAPVLQLANPVALAFSSDGTQLFAIDSASGNLAILDLASFGSHTMLLQGITDPFAVSSGPGGKVYIAGRNDHVLQEYDLGSGQPLAQVPLYFAPTQIEQFGANSFLLAPRVQPADPLWLATSGAQPLPYFVPAIPQTIGRSRLARQNLAPVGASSDTRGTEEGHRHAR